MAGTRQAQPLRQFHLPTRSTKSGFGQARSSPRSPVMEGPHRQPFSPRVSRAAEQPWETQAFQYQASSSSSSSTSHHQPSKAHSYSTSSSHGRARPSAKRARHSVGQGQERRHSREVRVSLAGSAAYDLAPADASPALLFYPPRPTLKTHSTGSSSTSSSSSSSDSSSTSRSDSVASSSYEKPLPPSPAGTHYHGNYASSTSQRRHSRHQPVIVRTSSETFTVFGGLKAVWKKATAHVRSTPARDSVLWSGFMPVQPEPVEVQPQSISRPGSRGSNNSRNAEWWQAREVAVVGVRRS